MKLYRLMLIKQFPSHLDVNNAYVIAAPTHLVARRLAAEEAEDEEQGVWFDSKSSTCEQIGTAKVGQEAKVILCQSRRR